MGRQVIVLDTTVLIDQLRGVASAGTALRRASQQGHRLQCSVVSRTEVLRGARREELPQVGRLFDALEWLPVTSQVADLAGALGARYRATHGLLDLPDTVVAATALVAGADIWTSNVRHFPMFNGLAAPY